MSETKVRANQYIVLLRGINVSGRNKIPMLELRSMCGDLGHCDVETYIQSGNVVLKAAGAPAKIEAEIEKAIERRFGLSIPVVVRRAADWPSYVKGNPFAEASQTAPNAVMLALSKAAPKPDAAEKLCERAINQERIIQVGDALWIHYANGVANSKLSPALFDRLVGSPVTARNWRTVLKLAEMTSQS
jgi:uncharacterized protein (DUF1697 family)